MHAAAVTEAVLERKWRVSRADIYMDLESLNWFNDTLDQKPWPVNTHWSEFDFHRNGGRAKLNG